MSHFQPQVFSQKGQSSLELAVTLPTYALVVLCFASIVFNYYVRNRADYILHEGLVCQVSATDSGGQADCQETVNLQLAKLPGKPKVDLRWDISSDQAEAQLNLTYQVQLAGGIQWHIKINRGVDLPLVPSDEGAT